MQKRLRAISVITIIPAVVLFSLSSNNVISHSTSALGFYIIFVIQQICSGIENYKNNHKFTAYLSFICVIFLLAVAIPTNLGLY